MDDALLHSDATKEPAPTRRRFLGLAATAVGGSLFAPSTIAAPADPLRMPMGAKRSRVVQISSRHVVDGPLVHGVLLREMFDACLQALTETRSIRDAWHALLRPDDVIGLKFNRSGQRVLATTASFAEMLIASIVDAGWESDRIVCMEAPSGTAERYATSVPRTGYDSLPTGFASGSDQFASVLRQITALIDIPFLKSHNIAGMTCALKNLSHGLVKHPARFHGEGCSPFIGDIVAAPPIRSRLRLCIADVLRVVFDRGPEATADTISDHGTLLASVDPVALDTVGLTLLNDVRRHHNLAPIARSAEELGYLASAHRSGLGIAMWQGIDLQRLDA